LQTESVYILYRQTKVHRKRKTLLSGVVKYMVTIRLNCQLEVDISTLDIGFLVDTGLNRQGRLFAPFLPPSAPPAYPPSSHCLRGLGFPFASWTMKQSTLGALLRTSSLQVEAKTPRNQPSPTNSLALALHLPTLHLHLPYTSTSPRPIHDHTSSPTPRRL